MQSLPLEPTSADRFVAKAAAQHTNHLIQNGARITTWVADAHVLGAIAAIVWLVSRGGGLRQRAVADHAAATVATAVIAPKLIKKVVNRTRPDRVVVGPDRQGVKTSGKPHDSFPSGHAVHIGALVSALSRAYPEKRWHLRAVGAVVAGTRVAVLAHWSTDVIAGLIIGVLLERGVRQVLTAERRKTIDYR
jgi:membrane-associated phospholipid phosphatase